jgi:molybdate transport system substrate-binding protein
MKPKYFLAITVVLLTACTAEPPALTVSAAANLQAAFTEIGAAFEQQTGTRVQFNFAATGSLGQQIAQGAPVDLFASADRATVDDLAARGFIVPETVRVYARGQIVLYSRADGPALQALGDLTRPEIKRVAIANPETAPYGRAAQEAMQNAGVWTTVQPKLVIAENIQQTQQFADTGNVDVAIVARSLTIAAKGQVTAIAPALYQPIDQSLGVVKGAKNDRDARAFAAFVLGAQGRAILEKYGYGLPNAK